MALEDVIWVTVEPGIDAKQVLETLLSELQLEVEITERVLNNIVKTRIYTAKIDDYLILWVNIPVFIPAELQFLWRQVIDITVQNYYFTLDETREKLLIAVVNLLDKFFKQAVIAQAFSDVVLIYDEELLLQSDSEFWTEERLKLLNRPYRFEKLVNL